MSVKLFSNLIVYTKAEIDAMLGGLSFEPSGAVATHAALATGIHGVGASTVASVANIATHAALLTGIHGLAISAGKTLTVSDSTTLANAAMTLANGKVLTLTASLTVEGGNAGILHFDAAATLTIPATGTAALLGANNIFAGLVSFDRDMTYANMTANPVVAQVVVSDNMQRLYLGAYYEGGVGAGSSIQSSQFYAAVDHYTTLLLNPNGGQVVTGGIASAGGGIANFLGTTQVTWLNGALACYGLVNVGTPATGGSLFVQTPSLNASYLSGFGVDGTYAALKSVINLKACGVYSGGYSADLAFWTSSTTTLAEKMRLTDLGVLKVDHVAEFTAAHGVVFDGKFGCNGVVAQAKAAHIANPTDLASALTAIASALTVLENFGLVATA
jgi:hypothetical protein